MFALYRYCKWTSVSRVYYCPVFSVQILRCWCSVHTDDGSRSIRNGDTSKKNFRQNSLHIQMLSSSLHKQIFKSSASKCVDDELAKSSEQNTSKSIEHLKLHGLWGKEASVLPDVDFKLPKLYGNNIDEHFREIALQQSAKYYEYAQTLSKAVLPEPPSKWSYETGWTKYNIDGTSVAVDFPEETALVFDIELLVTEGHLPTLATAVSPLNWYSWCSERLVDDRLKLAQKLSLADLINLETKVGQLKPTIGTLDEKIIVGHNVGFDRAFIKEQYFVKKTKARFIDTMSMHIAISGLTGLQRALLMAHQTGSKRKDVQEAKARIRGPPVNQWMEISCLNNLADVYKLYCEGRILQKEKRETFVKGNITDVRANFQDLMSYCAQDVQATHSIFAAILPTFFERFPHPVTFAGMLEMGCAYLPINHNWERYIIDTQLTYDDLEKELKLQLMRLANDACGLLNDDRYKKDPWLWDLDWSVNELKIKKIPPERKSKSRKSEAVNEALHGTIDKKEVEMYEDDIMIEDLKPVPEVQGVLDTAKHLYSRQSHLVGYPYWYRQLCPKIDREDNDWVPGPTLISHQAQVCPKLLRLTWDGYPLHYSRKNGWGYLVPGKAAPLYSEDELHFPLEEMLKICPVSNALKNEVNKQLQAEIDFDALWAQISDGVADAEEESKLWDVIRGRNEKKLKQNGRAISEGPQDHHGNGPYLNENIRGCWFYRLPHKDGPQNRVGNPLAKDFLNKIEDGTLKSCAGEHADWALKMNKMLSYWRNAHKRITSQMVVILKSTELPRNVIRATNYEEEGEYGAILPRIVTAGTVTRRAVEPTWLTASNAYVDRVGSELKAMIQAFPGYHFVGADVDSQELWIAAILGDAKFAGIHGCTAFGWMTLQGKKSNATDMHSKTALTVGITREQAKVMNYGRIYGAGQQFASRLLMQFNHRLTLDEAKRRALTMYAATKGVKGYALNKQGKALLKSFHESELPKQGKQNNSASKSGENLISRKDLLNLLKNSESELQFQDVVKKSVWMGGTESAMFNKLEEIALSPEPKTPVLQGKISRALESAFVMDNFMTSRVNWVVQSSAVDYLHLMLVSMKWLFDSYNIDGRFCISIHDEVRYLVKSEDRYRAALALQITNLLTRSMFAYKLGINDLPQSVAFFSAVDIDTVLRKEVHLDCKTPSNIHGLEKGYGITHGEAMDIYAILEKTNARLSKS